jgi:hypothetical protein
MFDVDVWNTILSSVAPSTKQSYQAVFLQFVPYFEERGFDFVSLNVHVMLGFLQTFVGKSMLRVKTAVAALKFFLRIFHCEDLADHPLVSLFGKGAQNVAPTQIWSPKSVLNDLKTHPIPCLFLACAKEAILLCLSMDGNKASADVQKNARRNLF